MYRGSSAKELYNRVNCYILSVSNALTLERVICSPRKVATAYRFILKVSIKALCMKPRLDTTNNTFAIIQRAKEWKFRQIFRNFPEIYMYKNGTRTIATRFFASNPNHSATLSLHCSRKIVSDRIYTYTYSTIASTIVYWKRKIDDKNEIFTKILSTYAKRL